MFGATYGLCIFFFFYIGTANCVQFEKSPNLIANQNGKAEINCKHDDSNLAVMLWYRQQRTGMPLDLIGYGYFGSPANPEPGFTERFTQTRQDTVTGSLTISDLTLSDSALYYCAASTGGYAKLEFGEGTKLTVLATNITLPKVKILPPSPREICSQKERDSNLTLVCVATGFYPDHVSLTWKVNGKERADSVSTDSTAQQDNMTLLYHISSRMKVSKEKWLDPSNKFTCVVRFYNGEDYVNVTNTIKGQKEKPKGLKLLGFGYILFLSKSLLYALIVSGVVWKLKFSMKMKPFPED